MPDFTDLELTCRDCNKPFTLTAKDQAFFARMTDDQGNPFKNPTRCKPCRDLKKAERMGFASQPIPVMESDDGFHPKKKTGRRRDRDNDFE